MTTPKLPARTKRTYQQVMTSIEERITADIDAYLKANKITYSCNSDDFITGLTLGLKVASENVYNATTGKPTNVSDSSGIALYKSIRDMKNE